MKTKLKTAPATDLLTLEEIKQQRGIVIGDTWDDDFLKSLRDTAIEEVEAWLRRRCITQTWYFYLQRWPDRNYIVLPYGSLQSVTAITYKDTDGDSNTFSTDDYIVESDTDPGRVVLAYGESWPSTTLYPSNPIRIEFICGYGDSRADVPESIRSAAKLIVADMFENREPTIIGTIVQRLPTVENLLTKYKAWWAVP